MKPAAKLPIILASFAGAWLLPAPARTPAALMAVVNKAAHTVTIYRLPGDRRVCTAEVAPNPHEAAFSRHGRELIVPIYSNVFIGQRGTNQHLVYFLDARNCRRIGVLDTGRYQRLHGIAVAANGRVYITAEVGGALLEIDPRRRRLVRAIPTGSPYSHMVALAGGRAYVSNVLSKTISVLSLRRHKLLFTTPTGAVNQRISVSPNHQWFATCLGSKHAVAVYRASHGQPAFRIATPGTPYVVHFSPRGHYLYAGGNGRQGTTLWKLEIARRRVVYSRTGLGSSLGSFALAPGGRRIYVTDYGQSRISVLKASNLELLRSFPSAGKGPDEIAFHQR